MFGLAFLNFLGSVLFFAFLLILFKGLTRKMHYAKGRSCWGDWEPSSFRRETASDHDDAMHLARERLANSELSPEDFSTIRQSLRSSVYERQNVYNRDDAFKTIRMRLAKGEISAEEFERLRQALS